MKTHLSELLQQSLMDLRRERRWAVPDDFACEVERTRTKEHGEFCSNAALLLSAPLGRSALDIAQALADGLPESRHVAKVEVAGPGFINFHLSRSCLHTVVRRVLESRDDYGRVDDEEGERITVEFVSANPTGPLHVGHGRGAAFGDSLAALLQAQGKRVHREYYVNDNGRQMDILAASVWLRYLELTGTNVPFPELGYQGEYVYSVARDLRQVQGDRLRRPAPEISADLPADGVQGDAEAHIDALVARCKALLGDDDFGMLFDAGLNAMLADIRDDLDAFGVHFDTWYSERSLTNAGRIQAAIDKLRAGGHIYSSDDGALWFKASELGDEKDRVIIRSSGRATYFASDIAYLWDKFERGFERAIYVFGADHHGYVARLQAAARGLGLAPERIEILLVQFAVLYRGEDKVAMSTRKGEYVSLRELRAEVGADACRYYYVMRSNDQHLDFDLDLAKTQSKDNPVHYVQYAHARIAAVFRELAERHLVHNRSAGDAARNRLVHEAELELMNVLMRYPEAVEQAACSRAPHQIANYLRDLAQSLHAYYDGSEQRILCNDDDLRHARLSLLLATKQVLANGMGLLGVRAPESM